MGGVVQPRGVKKTVAEICLLCCAQQLNEAAATAPDAHLQADVTLQA
jgi:hypothetical protein